MDDMDDFDDSEDSSDTNDNVFDNLMEGLEKLSHPLAVRREIERRLELSRMRDQLGIDDFDAMDAY